MAAGALRMEDEAIESLSGGFGALVSLSRSRMEYWRVWMVVKV